MLIPFLTAVIAATPTAVDAERAFVRDAQIKGQWTAARAYADSDAVMFTPQAVWARDFLKGRKDPPVAARWSPNESYVSCDGRLAVNTGPWQSADGRRGGFYTSVWQQENGRWRWVADGRHMLKRPRAMRKAPLVQRGSCIKQAPRPPLMAAPTTQRGPGGAVPDDFGRGHSADHTLGWDWRVGPKGIRRFRVYLWTGRAHKVALDQTIGGITPLDE